MALNKLRKLDPNSIGVTIPKDDLRVEGLVNDDGELEGEHILYIRHVGDGEWRVKLVDRLELS